MLWSRAQRSRQRIGWAITLSLLLHYLVAGSWHLIGQRSHEANASRLLEQTGFPSGIVATLMHDEEVGNTAVLPPEQPGVQHGTDASRSPPVTDPITDARAKVMKDDRFYSARELDRYPAPAVPLDISMAMPSGIGGPVRMFVDIDHGGRVVALAAIEAESSVQIESALREALMRTLFTPASKDGRAVNSRIMMEFRAP